MLPEAFNRTIVELKSRFCDDWGKTTFLLIVLS